MGLKQRAYITLRIFQLLKINNSSWNNWVTPKSNKFLLMGNGPELIHVFCRKIFHRVWLRFDVGSDRTRKSMLFRVSRMERMGRGFFTGVSDEDRLLIVRQIIGGRFRKVFHWSSFIHEESDEIDEVKEGFFNLGKRG